MTTKEKLLKLLDRLPNSCTLDDVLRGFYGSPGAVPGVADGQQRLGPLMSQWIHQDQLMWGRGQMFLVIEAVCLSGAYYIKSISSAVLLSGLGLWTGLWLWRLAWLDICDRLLVEKQIEEFGLHVPGDAPSGFAQYVSGKWAIRWCFGFVLILQLLMTIGLILAVCGIQWARTALYALGVAAMGATSPP